MLSLADVGTTGSLVPGGTNCWFHEGRPTMETGWEPSIQSPTIDGVTGTSTLPGRRWADGGTVSDDKLGGALISDGGVGGVRVDENMVSVNEITESERSVRFGEGGGE